MFVACLSVFLFIVGYTYIMRGRNRTKVGNRKGNPAYRTAATFRYRQHLKVQKSKMRAIPTKSRT